MRSVPTIGPRITEQIPEGAAQFRSTLQKYEQCPNADHQRRC